jgi:hypothetical protein
MWGNCPSRTEFCCGRKPSVCRATTIRNRSGCGALREEAVRPQRTADGEGKEVDPLLAIFNV